MGTSKGPFYTFVPVKLLMHKLASRLLLGALCVSSLTACNKIDSTPFVGTWRYSSGGVVQTCDGVRSNDSIEGEAVISDGTQTDLVLTYNNCAICYDLPLAGNTASAKAQSCGGGLLRVDVTDSSLSLDNGKLRQVEHGSFTAFGKTCVYNTDAYLTRVDSSPVP